MLSNRHLNLKADKMPFKLFASLMGAKWHFYLL